MTPEQHAMTAEEKMVDLWEAMVPVNPVTGKLGWLASTDERLGKIEMQQALFLPVADQHNKRWPNGSPMITQDTPTKVCTPLATDAEITKEGVRLSWRAVRWLGFTLAGLIIGWVGHANKAQSTDNIIQTAVTKSVSSAIADEIKHEAMITPTPTPGGVSP